MNDNTSRARDDLPVPTGKYAREIDVDSDSTHARVVRLVGTDRKVLELGPGPGHMTAVLSDRGCTVVGIELDAEAAVTAGQFSERVIVGDLDELDLASELADARFDVIVAADVLEHLKDPLKALERLRSFLAPGGFFVISLPNVAHGSVRLALLAGHFPYQNVGLLDRTHLRFFTRESIDEMLDQAELGVAEIFRQPLDVEASEVPFDASAVPPGVLDALQSDPEARTYQFVIKAIPIEIKGLREMQRRMRELADETALMRARNLELETDNTRLRAENAHTAELRAALIETHDQVLRRDEVIHRFQEEMRSVRAELQQNAGLASQLAAEREQTLRLRVRLNRIAASPPMRAYEMIGQLPGVRGLKARRTAGYQREVLGAKASSPDG